VLRPDLLKVRLSPCFRPSSLLLLSLLPLVGGLAASAEGRASRMSVNEAALPSAPPTRSSSAEASAVLLARLSESRSTSPSNRKVVTASLSTLPSGFQDTTVVSGLDLPIALSFAPDGKVFVAVQRGIIKEFSSLSDTHPSVYADFPRTRTRLWSGMPFTGRDMAEHARTTRH